MRRIIENIFQKKGFLFSFLALFFSFFLFLSSFFFLTVFEGFFAVFFALLFFCALAPFLLYVLGETKEKL
jgi:hypothetical protein